MASAAFAGGPGCCNKQISITTNNRTANASCVDECPSCDGANDLDLTKGLFEFFSGGDLNVGVLSALPSLQTSADAAESTTPLFGPTNAGGDCDDEDEDDPSADDGEGSCQGSCDADDEEPANASPIGSEECDDDGDTDEDDADGEGPEGNESCDANYESGEGQGKSDDTVTFFN
ncbi:hypothetical protein B0H14DRAFT_3885046 [Mycena olivaceomarginata]|nr:hypothetical protein B0H14DRAFT_3885046 [Mycena olivaceomarginata]